jgi:cellulose biosynthesis protein BcsQ
MLTAGQLAEWLGCGDAGLANLPEQLDHLAVRRAMRDAGWGYRRIVACIGVEKGGVGKTFLTINTAAALARHGARVLLMDFDPQCCATNYMLPDEVEADGLPTFLNVVEGGAAAVMPSRFEGADLVPARPELRRLERYADARGFLGMVESFVASQTAYDVILFDIPPFFGTMSSSCYVMCDLVVFPVTPDAWSIESVSLTAKDVVSACIESGRPNPAFAVLPNKTNPNRRSTGEVMARLREEYGDILVPFSVRESAGGLNAMNDGYDVFARRDAKILREPLTALARHICPPVKISRAGRGAKL